MGLPSEAGRDNEKNLCLKPPIFLSVNNIAVKSKRLESNNCNNNISSSLKRLKGRFSHWDDYQKVGKEIFVFILIKIILTSGPQPPMSSPPARRLLACTAFGAFLAINYRCVDCSMRSVLRCLYKNEVVNKFKKNLFFSLHYLLINLLNIMMRKVLMS